MKVSDYIIQFLVEHGVKHVFLVTGGGAMHLNHSLSQEPSITPVCMHHEQAAAIAAEAYAKATGKLGVCMVTSGPGGLNALTGCAAAYFDSTPVLFLSGQVKTSDLKGGPGLRQKGPQENDIVSMVKPITKYAVSIHGSYSIRYDLEKAVHFALKDRMGPVWLDIPLDVQAAELGVPFETWGYLFPRKYDPDFSNHIPTIIDKLNASSRPLLFAGSGIRLAHAEKEFEDLKALIQIPTVCTWLTTDLVPERIGCPGNLASRAANFAVQNCDFLLCIGTRLDNSITAFDLPNFAKNAWKAVVDVDPAELGKLLPCIQQAVLADAKAFIVEFMKQYDPLSWHSRADWWEKVNGWCNRYPVVTDEHRKPGLVSVYHFSETLAKELDKDDKIVVGSSGAAIEMFLMSYPGNQRLHHSAGLGAMGFALPSAVGVALANPGKRVICIEGDGGFLLNVQALETIRRLNLPIKVFALNNFGYSSIRASQRAYFGKETIGCDKATGLSIPDISSVSHGFGIRTAVIHSQRDLAGSIRHVLSVNEPIVCDVRCIPNEPREPRVQSRIVDGQMVSGALENLHPYLSDEELAENMISNDRKSLA